MYVDCGTGAVTTAICRSGIVIMAYSDSHGWSIFFKKCGPVPGNNSLHAELGGCGMLMDDLCHWMTCAFAKKRAHVLIIEVEVVSLPYSAIFGGMRFPRVDRDRAHHISVVLEGGSGSGVRRYGGMGTCVIEG